MSPPLERGVAIALLTPGLREVGVGFVNITGGAGVRGGSGGPFSSSSPASLVSEVSSLPGVSTSSMSHTSLAWEFGVVRRVGEGSLSLQGESTAGEERWDGESKEALGGASGVVGCEF